MSAAGEAPAGGTERRPVRGALFDLDGTLVDTGPDIAAAINRMLADMGRPMQPAARVLEWVGDGAPRLVQRALAGGLDGEPPAEDCSRGLARFQKHYANDICVDSRPYPNVREALVRLRGAGLPLGCVTNKPERLSRLLLDAFDMLPWFEVIVGGDTLEHRKPRPEPIQHAGRRLHLRPADMVYVGDSLTDCHAAAAAGVRMVAVSYGYNRGADLTHAACAAIIADFGELPDILEHI